jgi:hypothetical protein
MSVWCNPTARTIAFTRADPPLVDPPSQVSSPLAALSSDGTSIFRSSRSTVEPGCGLPRRDRMTSIAIATFSVEAAGNSARAFQVTVEPVRRSRTKIPHRPGNPRASPRISRPSLALCGGARDLTMRGRPKTGATVVDDCRLSSTTAITVRRTTRGGNAMWKSNVRRPPRRSRLAATRPSIDTITMIVPGPTRPAIRPNETSYGAGAIRTGGGSATGTSL